MMHIRVVGSRRNRYSHCREYYTIGEFKASSLKFTPDGEVVLSVNDKRVCEGFEKLLKYKGDGE